MELMDSKRSVDVSRSQRESDLGATHQLQDAPSPTRHAKGHLSTFPSRSDS